MFTFDWRADVWDEDTIQFDYVFVIFGVRLPCIYLSFGKIKRSLVAHAANIYTYSLLFWIRIESIIWKKKKKFLVKNNKNFAWIFRKKNYWSIGELTFAMAHFMVKTHFELEFCVNFCEYFQNATKTARSNLFCFTFFHFLSEEKRVPRTKSANVQCAMQLRIE